ncbi:MAG: hypothetical protein P4L42_13980 [Desulfocapsaceae bacterium]|nr:hypothetical protein [Desulfocapsaceae bacterium]
MLRQKCHKEYCFQKGLSMNKTLLHSPGEGPLHIECSDGRIVNIGTPADKEYEFFVVGSVECISDAFAGKIDGGNFLETHTESSPFQILYMTGGGNHSLPCGRTQKDIRPFNLPHTAGGEDMLSVKNGVVEQIPKAVEAIVDQVALDHGASFCVVCEGPGVARQVAEGLSARLKKVKE